jgi:DEAD/DEAH box helicase domain-containing protein
LLPGLIKFAYISRNEHRIHGDTGPSRRDRKGSPGPDFILPQTSVSVPEDEDHVLVLELAENLKGKKSEHNMFVNFPRNQVVGAILKFSMIRFAHSGPASLTPAAVKKLIEKRNERFSQAVDECVTLALVLPVPS